MTLLSTSVGGYTFCSIFACFCCLFTSITRRRLQIVFVSAFGTDNLFIALFHYFQGIVTNNQLTKDAVSQCFVKIKKYRAVPGSIRSTNVPDFEMLSLVQISSNNHFALLANTKNLLLTVKAIVLPFFYLH